LDIKSNIRKAGYHWRWLMDIMSYLVNDKIVVPSTYREKVLHAKKELEEDTSGLINSMLDFAINSATDVDYYIESDNENLEKILNDSLKNINKELRGKIPTGIAALAKEYCRERWKGSSLLLLRTVWERRDGIILPTKLWFVDGEDISVKDSGKDTVRLGEETYSLRIDENRSKSLPTSKDEMIFVQKPYSGWGTMYPVPFLYQRGLWRNLKFLKILSSKGENVAARALEYILMMKKGTEGLVKQNIVYDENDLKKIKSDFEDFMQTKKNSGGTPTYATNFDTEIEHLIPEYEKILSQSLYSPIEKRILQGLGLIEIIEGTASSRKESILNPKPFNAEVNSGVNDFKQLINEVLLTIIEKNKITHRKYFSDNVNFSLYSTPVKALLTSDAKELLRNAYDRGNLSKQTFTEVVGEVDYNVELMRRRKEARNGDDVVLYPHPTQNNEKDISPLEELKNKQINPDLDPDDVPEEKKTDTQDYTNAIEFEEAPYKKNSELPKNVKSNMEASVQTAFRLAFNNAFKEYDGDETIAFRVAWAVVRKIAKKSKDGKWVMKRKSKAKDKEEAKITKTINNTLTLLGENLEDFNKKQESEINEKKLKLLDKLLGETNE